MSGRSFRSVFMVASCAGAALSCYLVSLRVASERAALEEVQAKIVLAQRDIRLLQTEIGTRGRLAQLERWNVKVLALSAPSADQFLDGGFALARLARPAPTMDLEAPVVLAAAPAMPAKPSLDDLDPPAEMPARQATLSAKDMMHVASLKRESRPSAPAITPPVTAPPKAAAPTAATAKAKPVVAKAAPDKKAKQAVTTSAPDKKAKPAVATTAPDKKTKPAPKAAASDPLAPLPTAKPKPTKLASNTPKDSARKQ